jgi:hypothetical protein
MVQLGNGSGWKEVHFFAWQMLVAVTQSGELWEWTRRFSLRRGEFVAAEMPSQYSDWTCASLYDGGSFLALASDGKVCQWGNPEWFSMYSDHFIPGYLLPASRIKARTIAEIHR